MGEAEARVVSEPERTAGDSKGDATRTPWTRGECDQAGSSYCCSLASNRYLPNTSRHGVAGPLLFISLSISLPSPPPLRAVADSGRCDKRGGYCVLLVGWKSSSEGAAIHCVGVVVNTEATFPVSIFLP